MSTHDNQAKTSPPPRAPSRSEGKAPLILLLAGGVAICCLGLPLVAGLVYLCIKDPAVLVEAGEGNDKADVPNPAPGKMPRKDPQQEAEFSAAREKRLEALRQHEKKVVQAVKNWPRAGHGDQGQIASLPLGVDAYAWEAFVSPDGRWLATLVGDLQFKRKDRDFQIFELTSGKLAHRLPAGADWNMHAAFSPDGSSLVSAGFDRQITIWDVKSGQKKAAFAADDIVFDVLFAPDSKDIVASIQGRLVLLNGQTGSVTRTFAKESENAARLAISPRGDLLAAVVGTGNNRLAIWEFATGAMIVDAPQGKTINQITFSPDGWKLVMRMNDDVVLRDLETGKQQSVAKAFRADSPVFSPDGKYLAFRSTKLAEAMLDLVILDLATGKEVRRVPRLIGTPMFFPGGLLLAGFDNSTLRIWAFDDLLDPFFQGFEKNAPIVTLEKDSLLEKHRARLFIDERPTDRPIVTVTIGDNEFDDDGLRAVQGELAMLGRRIDVNLNQTTKLTEEGLAALKGLPNLVGLQVERNQLTDAALPAIGGFTDLETLAIGGDALTDEGLAPLAHLKKVRQLNFRGAKLTAKALVHVKDLVELRDLNQFNVLPGLNNETLGHLRKLTKLRYLRVPKAGITDDGLAHLKNMQGLNVLILSDNRVTDTGLANLAKLTNLETLDLNHTAITDAGLKHLTGLSNLKELRVRGTAVTQDGEAMLKEALPKLRQVFRD